MQATRPDLYLHEAALACFGRSHMQVETNPKESCVRAFVKDQSAFLQRHVRHISKYRAQEKKDESRIRFGDVRS